MNSELMNILIASVITGLLVMAVTWSIAVASAARQIEEAVRDASLRGKDMGRSEYLASPEFARKLRDAHEVGASIATEEMAAKVEAAYFKGVEVGTVDAEANHASDLVAARAAGYGEAVQAKEVFERLCNVADAHTSGYDSGYKDGEKQGYREGYEACDAERDKAITDMVDDLGGVPMNEIDEALKAVNFPECLGVKPIKFTREQKKAMDNPEMTLVIDATGDKPVVRIEPKGKPVKSKDAKIPEVLRRKPAKSPVIPPKEVKPPTRVKAAKPVKKPVADAGECPPCKPWEKTRRSR